MFDRGTVAVIIPTRDRPELTNRAVNSVSSSRPEKVSIVVVDDCGNTPYGFGSGVNAHGIKVDVLRTASNCGPGLARKFGVEGCSSHAVAFLDSDDIYLDGWVDEGLDRLSLSGLGEGGIFIAGTVKGGSLVLRAVFRVLTLVPERLRALSGRLAVVMFNPFYTPSLILSRDLCHFSESLRYCEDYYTNAMALFGAKEVIFSKRVACALSRPPGAKNGESANTGAMLSGELGARLAMFESSLVPVFYKLLVPLGVVYQLARASVQWAIGWKR